MDPIGPDDDQALLRRSRRDPEAYGRLYDRHVDAVLAFCLRRVADAETAADITAEVFAAAYVQRSRYRDTGAPFAAWLFGIARNQIASFARRERVSEKYRRKLGVEPAALGLGDIERIETLVDLEPVRAAVREAMSELPGNQADAVHLRVVDDLPYSEVAARLGCSEGAARVRVSRGLTKLADALEVSP